MSEHIPIYKAHFYTKTNPFLFDFPENSWDIYNETELIDYVKGCLNPRSGLGKILIEKINDEIS